MKTKWIAQIGFAILAAGMIGAFGFFSQALAQDSPPAGDSTCLSCHEQQYYLYDTGKWYCLNETPVTCIQCHGGQEGTFVKEEAHLGMNAYPHQDDGAVCQNCHPGDYALRVEKFSMVAGIRPAHQLCPTLPAAHTGPGTPGGDGSTGTGGLSAMNQVFQSLETWQIISLGFLALASIGAVLFAYRCWKADCAVRTLQTIGE